MRPGARTPGMARRPAGARRVLRVAAERAPRCASARPAPERLGLRATASCRYRVLKQLGDGTYGAVWKAVNRQTNEVVSGRRAGVASCGVDCRDVGGRRK